MPTIEQLEPVIVASDDDVLPVSQGGNMRRVTRAQFLTGTQSTLSLSPGLLGRVSQGVGAPEQITIGSGLSFASGVLSAAPAFSVAALPASSVTSASDLIPVSQAGRDRAVSVASLLSAAGADVSGQYVRGQRGVARRLADWMADSLAVEAFGAIGDGMADDTAAFKRAVATGRPISLGPQTYRVDGQWSITTSCILLGTPGVSTLRRTMQTGGAWIDVVAPSFTAYGISFDGGKIAADSWGILIDPLCTTTLFENCQVMNVSGATLGSGLIIQARDGTAGHPSSHTVRNCTFNGNAGHGLWIQAACGPLVEGCQAHNNGGYGICLDYNDHIFQSVVRQGAVVGCRCWQNMRGISIGNYNETNLEPPRWGLGNADAVDILVAGNVCSDNSAYAIAVSGKRIQVCHNQVNVGASAAGGSGILCNASNSVVSANIVDGPGMFGIDAGGCADCDITSNLVEGFDIGINAGGGRSIRVASNRLLTNSRGVTAFQIETDGNGKNFGILCADLVIDGNIIALKDSSGGGIILADGPVNVAITDNTFRPGSSSHPAQAIMANTDSVAIAGNRWDGSDTYTAIIAAGPSQRMLVPEVFDHVTIAGTAPSIAEIDGQYAASVAGEISFIRVVNGGSGYKTASVSIGGSGSGGQASAYIRDGVIVGIALTAGGAGYGQASTQVIITGDGSGALASAFIGLPVPNGRRLRVRCEAPVQFIQSVGSALQNNWTGADITVPAGAEIVWVGVAGGWTAVSFDCLDYLAPDGHGAVAFRSVKGDLTLASGTGGRLRISSATETSGFTSNLGRGSPEGVIAATVGSDYRNLDGGIGSTLWIKRVGTDASGWAAIA